MKIFKFALAAAAIAAVVAIPAPTTPAAHQEPETRNVRGYLYGGKLYTYEPGDHQCHVWINYFNSFIHVDGYRLEVVATMKTNNTASILDDEPTHFELIGVEKVGGV